MKANSIPLAPLPQQVVAVLRGHVGDVEAGERVVGEDHKFAASGQTSQGAAAPEHRERAFEAAQIEKDGIVHHHL